MSNFIFGTLAVIMLIVTYALRDSDNKWLSIIGWAIIIAAKMFG